MRHEHEFGAQLGRRARQLPAYPTALVAARLYPEGRRARTACPDEEREPSRMSTGAWAAVGPRRERCADSAVGFLAPACPERNRRTSRRRCWFVFEKEIAGLGPALRAPGRPSPSLPIFEFPISNFDFRPSILREKGCQSKPGDSPRNPLKTDSRGTEQVSIFRHLHACLSALYSTMLSNRNRCNSLKTNDR